MKKGIFALAGIIPCVLLAAACSSGISGSVSQVLDAAEGAGNDTPVTVTGYVPIATGAEAQIIYDETTDETISCYLANEGEVAKIHDFSTVTIQGKLYKIGSSYVVREATVK